MLCRKGPYANDMRKEVPMTTIHATWNSKMQFTIGDEAGREVIADSDPAHGGENAGMPPKQLVLFGLAGCTGMDVISILVKMRQPVEAFELNVTGHAREEPPKYYDRIEVEYVVTGDVKQSALDRAIELSRDKYCGVYAMIKDVAKVEFKSRIVKG